jgi:hypothetical protein
MGKLTIAVVLFAVLCACNKEKVGEASAIADVGLTPKSFNDRRGGTEPAWNRPSGKRFVSLSADVVMKSCQAPLLKATDAALVDPSYGRFPANGGAFGDQKAIAGTLADTELPKCTEGQTTPAEFVFLIPDNMDTANASLSFRGATAPVSAFKQQ